MTGLTNGPWPLAMPLWDYNIKMPEGFKEVYGELGMSGQVTHTLRGFQ